jgi:D-alanyl-D-alanine carboxypeptidase (penicillin-binding protein 5/6)
VPLAGWTVLAGVFVLFTGLSSPAIAADDVVWPKVRAKGLLLVELGRQEVLLEANAGKRLAPASLTKVMTALIAIDEGDPDAAVTVSRHAARATGHRLRLRAGQQFRLGDLIDAMLVTSANDACRAVAEAIGGSEVAFVARMNAYVAALHLPDTHFANACGFDAPGHYSTAQDLARLAAEALDRPAFAETVKLRNGVLRTLDGRRAYRFRTTNRLMMANFDGAVGVKTGFTRGAGRCLIARVVREQGDLLLVMLNAPRRWWDATTLLSRAFDTLADRTPAETAPSWIPVEPPADVTGAESAPSAGPIPL